MCGVLGSEWGGVQLLIPGEGVTAVKNLKLTKLYSPTFDSRRWGE